MIEALKLPFRISGHDIVISASVGIALAPENGTDADELFAKADLALYRAKGDGRGCCRLYKPIEAMRPGC